MEYRAITGENFYYQELKNTARYLLKNPNLKNMRDVFKEKDILDCTSESNFQKKFQTINKRVKYLTEELMYQLVNGDSNTGRFITLYTILCAERFLLEFLDEIIGDKYRHYDYYLKESDIQNFMNLKAEQSEIVEKWSESGKKKMIVKIKNFFSEGGFLYKEEEKLYKIVRPVILSEIIDEMKKEGNRSVVKAML
uniref:BrxA family protein n=1 Tax=Cetobacterium sp. TaxID=2071632 RepID=UPI003AEF698E